MFPMLHPLTQGRNKNDGLENRFHNHHDINEPQLIIRLLFYSTAYDFLWILFIGSHSTRAEMPQTQSSCTTKLTAKKPPKKRQIKKK